MSWFLLCRARPEQPSSAVQCITGHREARAVSIREIPNEAEANLGAINYRLDTMESLILNRAVDA